MIHISEDDLDLTGSLGMDFVNTVVPLRSGPVDLLGSPEAFVDWIRRAAGADTTSLVPADLPGRRILTAEARALREALVALFRSTADGTPASDGALYVVDRALRAGSSSYRLLTHEPAGGTEDRWRPGRWRPGQPGQRRPATSWGEPRPPVSGPPTVHTLFHADGPVSALTPIAVSAVRVAAEASPDRLRECDASDCRRWFVDTSKGGQRRWCSMARCGNRAKAARYRSRHADDG